jgi:hypothetical protein
MTDAPNRPLPVQLQEAHPEWVKELAFVCWLEADRNASRALDLLEQQWPEDEPRRPVAYRTLAAWAQRENWQAKADDLIADNFPGLVMRHTARLVYMAGLALTTTEEVISGDGFVRDRDGQLVFDRNGRAVIIDPRHQRNRLDGSIKVLELAGVEHGGIAQSHSARRPLHHVPGPQSRRDERTGARRAPICPDPRREARSGRSGAQAVGNQAQDCGGSTP